MKVLVAVLILLSSYHEIYLEACKSSGSDVTSGTNNLPTILTKAKTVGVKKGDNFNLICEVDNLGIFDITWLKDEKNVVSDTRVRIETVENGSSLIVSDSEEDDTGEYVCKVSNEEVRHVVEINVKPDVVPSSGHVIATEGENVTLSCNITSGGPVTDWKWEKDMEYEGLAYPMFSFGPTFTMSDIQRRHAGLYRCKAQNLWPKPGVAEIKLEVQYSPQITQTASFDDPYYLDPSERPGVKFTPTCIVEAWPNATVEWFKDGNKLPENDQIEIKDDGVYYGYPLTQMGFSSIKDAVNSSWSFDEAKLGVYECRAQNYIGTTTAAFNIFRRCDITGLQCWCDMTRASCLDKIKNVN